MSNQNIDPKLVEAVAKALSDHHLLDLGHTALTAQKDAEIAAQAIFDELGLKEETSKSTQWPPELPEKRYISDWKPIKL
jgi:hypothetical protein